MSERRRGGEEGSSGAAPPELDPNERAIWSRTVSEAALAVSSELDIERALQKIVDAARTLVHARYAALGVVKADMSGLSRFIVSGMTREQIQALGPWPRGRGLLGLLLREPRPLRIPKISQDPRSIGFPPHHPQMESFLGVPIRSGNRIIGNFYLTDKIGSEAFSQKDEDLLVRFADHAATAIENAERFTNASTRLRQSLLQVQRSEQSSRFLIELSGLLPTGPIVEEIPWEAVADAATEQLGDGCTIFLVDPNNPEVLSVRVTRHRDPARAEADQKFIEESWGAIRTHVLEHHRSIFVAGLESGAVPAGPLDVGKMREAKLSAVMVLPIRSKQKMYGVFASMGSQPATFSEEDLALGALIAERLGIALENAELISQLRAALDARDNLVSIATHELKTPITALKGYVQLLLAGSGAAAEKQRQALEAIDRETERVSDLSVSTGEVKSAIAALEDSVREFRTQSGTSSDQQRRFLDTIDQQTSRLVDLINRLLEVSRLREGRLGLRRERFDLMALCREVVDRFLLLASQQGEAPRLRLQTEETELWGDWDRGRIDQVLTNLLSNALKYSPGGGEVLIEVRRVKDKAQVSVTDQGMGIPAESRHRIFEPFYRTSNAEARRIEGSGLGLHISRGIVEQHGGHMWFESEEGKGSSFSFTLPLAKDDGGPP